MAACQHVSKLINCGRQTVGVITSVNQKQHQAYPPGRLCRARELGVACCWGTEHFQQPRICLFTTTVTYKRFCYPELTQDRWTPSACRCCCLQESTRSPLQLACRQPQSADQHPATVSFPNTHWTAHDSALGEFWWRMARGGIKRVTLENHSWHKPSHVLWSFNNSGVFMCVQILHV